MSEFRRKVALTWRRLGRSNINIGTPSGTYGQGTYGIGTYGV